MTGGNLQDIRAWIEFKGRRLLLEVIVRLFRRRLKLACPNGLQNPKILVVRIDERVGNIVMMTPLLENLRNLYPHGTIHLLGNRRSQEILQNHQSGVQIIPFTKRNIFGTHGIVKTMAHLRKEKYQIAFDAGNPTVPSLTHHLITRLAGAKYCAAITEPQFSDMFDHASTIPKAQQNTYHEIEMRLELLSQFPPHPQVITPSLRVPQCPKADAILKLHNLHRHPFFILNLGARLKEKQLSPTQYSTLASIMGEFGVPILCTWGPNEKVIAKSISKNCDHVIVAPDTNLQTLSVLMAAATATVSCDTGPMHISVALKTPTCGIFVSTDPTRYGYKTARNQVIDARQGFHPDNAQTLRAWISQFR